MQPRHPYGLFFKIKIRRIKFDRTPKNCNCAFIILVTEGLVLRKALRYSGNVLPKISDIAFTVNKTLTKSFTVTNSCAENFKKGKNN